MKPRLHQNTRPTLLYANRAAFISWLDVAKRAILKIKSAKIKFSLRFSVARILPQFKKNRQISRHG
jgi:hypothetical protein